MTPTETQTVAVATAATAATRGFIHKYKLHAYLLCCIQYYPSRYLSFLKIVVNPGYHCHSSVKRAQLQHSLLKLCEASQCIFHLHLSRCSNFDGLYGILTIPDIRSFDRDIL